MWEVESTTNSILALGEDLVAFGARSILVIVWHLLNDPDARYIDLGSDYYTNRLDPDRKTRDLLRQLQVLGHNVTIAPAA